MSRSKKKLNSRTSWDDDNYETYEELEQERQELLRKKSRRDKKIAKIRSTQELLDEKDF